MDRYPDALNTDLAGDETSPVTLTTPGPHGCPYCGVDVTGFAQPALHLPAGENLSRCGVPVGDVCVACAALAPAPPLDAARLDAARLAEADPGPARRWLAGQRLIARAALDAQPAPPLVANKVFAGCICTVDMNQACPALSHQWAEI